MFSKGLLTDQLCVDTGCSLEDLTIAAHDRDGWMERLDGDDDDEDDDTDAIQ